MIPTLNILGQLGQESYLCEPFFALFYDCSSRSIWVAFNKGVMMDKCLKLFLFFAFAASHVSGQDDFEIVFSWTPLQFEWPNASFEAAYGDLKAAPVGIKPYGDNFYFAMPRYEHSKNPHRRTSV